MAFHKENCDLECSCTAYCKQQFPITDLFAELDRLLQALNDASYCYQDLERCFYHRIPGYTPQDIAELILQVKQHC